MFPKSLIVIIMVCNSLFTAAGQIFLKIGMNGIARGEALTPLAFILKALTTPFVIAGIAVYVLSLLIWLFVLSKVDLSFAYGLVALTMVFLLVFSRIFLHESVSLLRIFGSSVIILGVILLAKS